MARSTRSWTYNWQQHAQGNGFASWILPVLVTPLCNDGLEELSELTNHFEKVTLTIFVNGVEVGAKQMMDSLERNYEFAIAKACEAKMEEMLAAVDMDGIHEVVRSVQAEARKRIVAKLAELGVTIPEEDD